MSLQTFIDEHRQRFLDELTEFCRLPSISAEGRSLDETSEWVAARLEEIGATTEILDVPGGPPAVLGELGPTDAARTLLIYNHYDVQPVDPLDLWDSPPFEPAIRDDRFFARGIADNKANFLSRVHAVEAWQATRRRLPLRIKWLLEGEEEIGSPHLTAFCETHGKRWADADGCVWESGYKDELGRLRLYSGLKGLAAFELRARGANADKHSALATLLPNPAWRLVWLLATLKAPDETILVEGLIDHVAPPSEAELRHLADTPFDDAAMRDTHGVETFVTGVTGKEALLRHLYQPTCTICGIGSGYSGPGMKTVLPRKGFAKLDFRLVPDLTPELVKDLLHRHLARHGFGDLEVIDLEGEHPAPGQIGSEVVKAALATARDVYGKEPVLWPHMVGSGPMYVVATQYGIPCVGFGTGYHGANVHAPNENIRLADYFEGIAMAARFFERFGRK